MTIYYWNSLAGHRKFSCYQFIVSAVKIGNEYPVLFAVSARPVHPGLWDGMLRHGDLRATGEFLALTDTADPSDLIKTKLCELAVRGASPKKDHQPTSRLIAQATAARNPKRAAATARPKGACSPSSKF